MTPVSTGVTQGYWCVSGHPAHPDFHGMVPSQQVISPSTSSATDNRKPQNLDPRGKGHGGGAEPAKDITPAVTGAHGTLGDRGGGTDRMLHVRGSMTLLGGFKIHENPRF